MHHFARLLAAFLCLSVLGAGCGSSQRVGNSNAAGITGVVTSGSPLAISSDAANTPKGHAPVAGAEVKVTDIFGDLVGQTVTGADGAFLVQGVPAGYLKVEVRADPASTDPDVAAEVTGIPGATIAVHRAYAVTREAAVAAALAGVSPDARVVGSLQPFPAGVVVRAGGGDPTTGAPPPPPRESTAPEWFFFIDLQPPAGFAHPVEYVFVNAETGAVERIQGLFWPPRVNGREIWGACHTFVQFGGLHPQEFDVLDPPAGLVAEPTAEVVQLPPGQKSDALTLAAPAPFLSELANHNVDPASIFAIVYQGSPELRMGADVDRMVQLLVDAGVPRSPNIRLIRSHEDGHTQLVAADAFSVARRDLDRLMQDRLDRDLHSTLIVYISSHGLGPSFSRTYDEKASDGDQVTPDLLLLGTTVACRLRVILEFCHSGRFASLLAGELNGTPPELRPDYVIYASSQGDEVSWGWEGAFLGLVQTGGVFTTSMLEYARVTSGDILGLLNAGGDGIREELDSIFSFPVLFESSLQHPSAIVRANVPVRCQDGAEPGSCVAESEPNNFVDDANPLGGDDCGTGALDPFAGDGIDIFSKTMTFGAWEAVLISGTVELGIQTDDDFIAGEPPISFDLAGTTDIKVYVINGKGPYEFQVRPR